MDKNSKYSSQYFQIKINQSHKTTKLHLQLLLPFVSTKYIPDTINYLEKHNPTVLKTQCFNDNNLPFNIEARETEIGHLFEHVLLDQLCLLEIQNGAISSTFTGRTYWNWQKNPYGKFEIWIDIGKAQLKLLIEALKKTIDLMENLLYSSVSIINSPVFYQPQVSL